VRRVGPSSLMTTRTSAAYEGHHSDPLQRPGDPKGSPGLSALWARAVPSGGPLVNRREVRSAARDQQAGSPPATACSSPSMADGSMAAAQEPELRVRAPANSLAATVRAGG